MRYFILLICSITSLFSQYEAKNFTHLYRMKGFDKSLLQMHFRLYQGYVNNTNFLLKEIAKTDGASYEFGALKRRLGWEMDGMRLHELYFSNLGGNGIPSEKMDVIKEIKRQFGSFNEWKKRFSDTGKIRGIGWVVLYLDLDSGKLVNLWINEHDTGHLAGGEPLLIMDVWEHAYITQFGLDRGKYIQTFLDHVNWNVINQRFMLSADTIHDPETQCLSPCKRP